MPVQQTRLVRAKPFQSLNDKRKEKIFLGAAVFVNTFPSGLVSRTVAAGGLISKCNLKNNLPNDVLRALHDRIEESNGSVLVGDAFAGLELLNGFDDLVRFEVLYMTWKAYQYVRQ